MNQISRQIASDECRSLNNFHTLWDDATTNGIHWVMNGRYYTVREAYGKRYFIFEDCIVLAWRFCRLYTIPLELEERMRSIMKWEDNYMAIAEATKSGDPLDVAIQKLYAENTAHNNAL